MAEDRNDIEFDAGPLTEELISYITQELDDETLDGVEVGRKLDRPDDLAGEPFTILAIAIGTTATIIQIGRITERWLEKKRQQGQVELLLKAYTISAEAGAAVERVVQRNTDVAKLMKLPEHPDYTKFTFGGIGGATAG
jgi:hypothetical protein